MKKLQTFIKNQGPGLLFASMAIGTSHLVLSTKAGATYGWLMVIPILMANLLKYPFFEFSIRYTNRTGKSIIEGYRNRGKGYLVLYAFITLATTFASPAALCAITAGLLINLLGIEGVSISTVALGLFFFNSVLLIVGKYTLLERTLKVVIPILFVALLITTGLVINAGSVLHITNFSPPAILDEAGILFLITLIGWMPTAVETSSWLSLWSVEKYKMTQKTPPLNEALKEFNSGYTITSILAFFFLTIGCMTLYGSGNGLSGNAVVFADQVITLFTTHIGNWAYVFIAVSAFATMYSTCLTNHDAIARVFIEIIDLFKEKRATNAAEKHYPYAVLFLAVISSGVLSVFEGNMGVILSLATFISFVLAPIVGYMNLKNVLSKELQASDHPGTKLRLLTYAGISFLSGLALYYGWSLLF